MDEQVQADLPEPDEEENIKIRPYERVKLNPKVPIEPSSYGKPYGYSRSWILQDGRENPFAGSEMRNQYKIPSKPPKLVGIRKRLLTNFFWGQMLEEAIDEISAAPTDTDYCSEYDSNYVKENFQPRNLLVTTDKTTHLKYPLYGTGSSAITFYSETVKKSTPHEILEKFRQTQDFTKPIGERFDDGWVL